MHRLIWTSVLALLFLLSGSAIAQEHGKPGRIFRSDDVLAVTITAPFKKLMRERPEDTDLPGKIAYTDAAGETVEIDIGVRTRGRYRRQMKICPFAPIRLKFDKKQIENTVFRKQGKLKLVTHCRNSSTRYEQLVLKEFLVYKILNQVTDYSFRVRLLRITYVDSDNPRDQQVRYGFLIENKERVAKRIRTPHVEVKSSSISALNGEYNNLVSVFQYFVANTDFSPIAGAPNDNCCHNTQLYGNPGELLYAIPYDFDMAGMTDAPYAEPNPKFKIRNVRQRLYRGRCNNNIHLEKSLQAFRENKDAFHALVEDMPDLTGSSKTSMFALMESFYKLIDNPKAVDKKLTRRCV